jgi:hypothetical protein
VRVDGASTPLYASRDGSGRLYFEARSGAPYELVLRNRSSERIGAVLVVDGLNAVSGERAEVGSSKNRMYVLDPWADVTVRGWRTSLSEVRRFTFVDEQASYAARSGKANGKMGWVEVGVFRERRPFVQQPAPVTPDEYGYDGRRKDDGAYGEVEKSAPGAAAPEAREESRSRDQAAGAKRENDAVASAGSGAARSYPGTGWGREAYDPARVVVFDPMPVPAQIVTLRYEYAPELRALGVLPRPWFERDRLSQRERAEDGFAAPPAW